MCYISTTCLFSIFKLCNLFILVILYLTAFYFNDNVFNFAVVYGMKASCYLTNESVADWLINTVV